MVRHYRPGFRFPHHFTVTLNGYSKGEKLLPATIYISITKNRVDRRNTTDQIFMTYRGNDYSNKLIDAKPHIWLQYYGWCEAKPAQDFKVGDFMRWNGGTSTKVLAIVRRTAKTIVFQLQEVDTRYSTGPYERTFKTDRWVAIGSEKI